ncbi:MAG: PTS sugar transporter subunit IIB [Firmicutes bacterium HGW-Firmicutes-20]|jgi:cellobiose PTS system EIIB component|nr:PTS sugar transporter subunit IIB [Erysipelotrichaceae bacterium]PKM63994.1 MAG: PTS sugar transporter subunit IIB [Firmicutes bacterium HGW-Firmicutes-20]PKM88219.1 MAG: PTS sugar transporter subunit IIB [Firmicutes bacterium HGW-Firmicutes-10]
MKKIVLLCAAGMSTSLLVNRMREAARLEGLDCTIDAFPTSQAAIHGKDADVVLLGPQVRFELKKVQGMLTCPVDAIDMVSYGTLNGRKVLDQAKKLMEENDGTH